MKILQIAPYFYPYTGGQERFVYSLCKYLVRMGHEVNVVTSNFPECIKQDVIDKIPIERHHCLVRPLRNPITPGMLQIKNKISDYDVVHSHNEHSFTSLVASYYRKRTGIPLVLTCHGQLKFGSLLADKFESLYSTILGRNIFRTSDKITALSRSDKKYISSFGINEDKIIELPNAIDAERLLALSSSAGRSNANDSIMNKYDIDGKLLILFIGPVIRRKGVEYLIRSIPEVVDTVGDNTIFVIVGHGDYLDRAKEIARQINVDNNVLFTGQISDTELIQFYKNSHLFVLPSLSEGLPTTILEAMFFGLPVVATDIPGIRDHFKNKAMLVRPADEHELAMGIIRSVDRSHEPSYLAREFIKKNYTWDVMVKEYIKVYENITNVKN